EHAAELVPVLVREAGRTFPASLAGVDSWTPPWSGRPASAISAPPVAAGPVTDLLAAHPATRNAVADLLGYDRTTPPAVAAGPPAARTLLAEPPETALAVAVLIGASG